MDEIRTFNISSADYNDLINSALMELKNKNAKYRKLQKSYNEIMDKFPNLHLIFEDYGEVELTKEEFSMLQKLLDLFLSINQIEEQAIFFLGGREAYFYFKSMGILKE